MGSHNGPAGPPSEESLLSVSTSEAAKKETAPTDTPMGGVSSIPVGTVSAAKGDIAGGPTEEIQVDADSATASKNPDGGKGGKIEISKINALLEMHTNAARLEGDATLEAAVKEGKCLLKA
jgi:hypothetical protein